MPRKLQSDELATVRLFQENTPSVVYITNLAVRQDAFTLDVLEVPQGSGSGFVWDKQGHIVTNYHVISGASDLKMHRQPEHVMTFLLAEMGTSGSLDGQQRLVVKMSMSFAMVARVQTQFSQRRTVSSFSDVRRLWS